jgi:CheY-like chemotaxis protein
MKPDNVEFNEIARPPDDTGLESEPEMHFDLSLLIKHDELNVRAAAEANPDMKVAEYLELISRFEELAGDVSEVLEAFILQDFNECKKGHRTLDDMIDLLGKMGCGQFVIDFGYLSGASRKKNSWSAAAAHAKQITEGFNGFRERLVASRSDDSQSAPHGDMPLIDYINMLDKDSISNRLSVMAVDDSPDILKAIYLVLKKNYKVFPVSDPTQVEEMLRYVKPDLFLLDYKMPQMDGLDIIPIIRGFEEHKDTPIVFLTGEGSMDRMSAAVLLGACDFMEKPIEANKLNEIIAKYI